MTKKHIIIAGAAIAALMLVYPPWVDPQGADMGYGFIASPPHTEGAIDYFTGERIEDPVWYSIDFGRLLIQLAAVGLITGAWVYVKKGK